MIALMRRDWQIYALLLALVTLLSTAFTMLRSARSALAVADVGGTAALVPYYELLGTLPMALALSWLLARLLRHFSLPRVFTFTLLGFIGFFIFYAACVYPMWRHYAPMALAFGGWWSQVIVHVPTLLFFAVAELWKVALFSILLWGYINRHIALEQAKILYAPLMLGNSLGAILAQYLTSTCSALPLFADQAIDHWHAALSTQLVAVAVLGVIILVLFAGLVRHLGVSQSDVEEKMPNLTLRGAVSHSWQSPYLRSLAVIVLVDYLVYSLIEVIFLEKLKEYYPAPVDYCKAVAQLSQWSGILTAVAALLIGPPLLKRLSWTAAALVTPLAVAPVAILFLGVVIAQEQGWLTIAQGIEYAVWSGSLFYCLGRSTKYALLDSSKELAFIPLSRYEQLQGKLAIEALASRGGRGMASIFSIVLFGLSGGIAGSALAALVVAIAGIGVWTRATVVVGHSMPAAARPVPSSSLEPAVSSI